MANHKPQNSDKHTGDMAECGQGAEGELIPVEDAEPYHLGIDIEQVRTLRTINGLTYDQIAKQLGCSKSTIAYHCRTCNIATREDLEQFKANRADILAAKQAQLSNEMTPDKVKKANLRDLVWGFGVLYDKERLERGQSTGNLSVQIDDLSDADRSVLAKLVRNIPDMVKEAEETTEMDAEYDG